MKTSRIFSAVMLAVCGMALCACTESIPDDNGGGKPVPTVLTASITQTTRTEIVYGEIPHPIHWEEGDIIAVHFDTDEVAGMVHWFRLKSGAGTTEGTFEWMDQGDPLPETYNSLVAGYAAWAITFSGDTEMVLEARSAIFMGLENIVDFPMHGAAAAGEPIQFRCSFGLVHIPITGNVVLTNIMLTTEDLDVPIAGTFKVDMDTDEAVFVKPSVGSEFEIVWHSTQDVALDNTPTDFYAVLPAGEYEAGSTFTFTLSDNSTIEKTTKQPFTVSRAQILNLPTLDVRQ